MCRLSITIDRSIHTIAPILDLIAQSTFQVRSVRLAPIAWSHKADVYLHLDGGTMAELHPLLGEIAELHAVLDVHHSAPPAWTFSNSSRTDVR